MAGAAQAADGAAAGQAGKVSPPPAFACAGGRSSSGPCAWQVANLGDPFGSVQLTLLPPRSAPGARTTLTAASTRARRRRRRGARRSCCARALRAASRASSRRPSAREPPGTETCDPTPRRHPVGWSTRQPACAMMMIGLPQAPDSVNYISQGCRWKLACAAGTACTRRAGGRRVPPQRPPDRTCPALNTPHTNSCMHPFL